MFLALVIGGLSLSPSIASEGADAPAWPRFRGPDGSGILPESSHPSQWSAQQNLGWSVEIPGGGWSSPIVVGDQVFLTTAVQEAGGGPMGFQDGVSDPMTRGQSASEPTEPVSFRLLCLQRRDGAEVWSREVGEVVPRYAVHPSNTYATETPTTDGTSLFVTFGGLGEVVCYSLAGEERWRVDTGVHKTGNDFGWGISLVCHEDLVFLQNDNEDGSFLVALDAATGDERWRQERGRGTSWGTPVLWSAGGRTQIVAVGSNTVVAYAPTNGDELWRVEGVGGSFSSSPTFDAERLYFGNSGPMSRGPMMAVPATLTGTSNVQDRSAVSGGWRAERAGPGFPSPVVKDSFLYVVGSPSVLACFNAETGERLWRERLPDAATIVSSPWIAGDRLFLLDEKGTTYVVQVGAEFELLGTNQLDGLYWGTPSAAGADLFLRSADRLHCIREVAVD